MFGRLFSHAVHATVIWKKKLLICYAHSFQRIVLFDFQQKCGHNAELSALCVNSLATFAMLEQQKYLSSEVL